MAYSTLPTVNAGDTISAATWGNIIKNDIEFLLSGQARAYTCYLAGSLYATTSTSFVDVDATNIKLTLTITSTRLMVICSFNGSTDNNAAIGAFRLTDGTTALGDAGLGQAALGANQQRHITLLGYWTGLTPGSITVKLQYKTTNASQTTTVGNIGDGNVGPIMLMAWEC